MYRGRKETAILPGELGCRGDPGGEFWELEEVQGSRDFSPEFTSGGSEIQTRTLSSFWCTIGKSKLSGRCAMLR
jgi:hypothetical protein